MRDVLRRDNLVARHPLVAFFGLAYAVVEGSLQAQGWTYAGVWCAVALGLLAADRKAWRRPRPAPQDAPILERSP